MRQCKKRKRKISNKENIERKRKNYDFQHKSKNTGKGVKRGLKKVDKK